MEWKFRREKFHGMEILRKNFPSHGNFRELFSMAWKFWENLFMRWICEPHFLTANPSDASAPDRFGLWRSWSRPP